MEQGITDSVEVCKVLARDREVAEGCMKGRLGRILKMRKANIYINASGDEPATWQSHKALV